jgi:acyl carrier protein
MAVITEQLKECFVKALQIDPAQVNDDLKYQGIQQWDSVSHMVLISEIEDTFKISLDTEDVLDMSSFPKAVEIVKKYTA